MKPMIRRLALVAAAAAAMTTVVQLPLTSPTESSRALTGAGSVTQLQITGRAGVPANASAVVLNLTTLDATAPGFVTAYPCGSTRPTASNLNYDAASTPVANSATVAIGTDGKVCLYTHTPTNLIADINGWYPANSDFTTTTPTRLLDTRTPMVPTGQFVETFDGNTGFERFNHGVYHRDEFLVGQTQWNGDHDLNCGGPETQRVIRRNAPEESFYLCKDHLMTSIGDTSGYSTGYFSPKESFTGVRSVSWDVNQTDLGHRQWWEVSVVPASFNSGVARCPQCTASADLASTAGLPVPPANGVVVKQGHVVTVNSKTSNLTPWSDWCDIDREGCASKTIRRTFTLTDNANGTITLNAHNRTFTFNGSFPPGPVNVVFKDHNYTPDKDGKPVGYTWHWDNIIIK